MAMREAVRSGRRANFFITENRFIDHYAAKVGGSGVAVYSILQRCANSETRETWISAGKMAEVLDIDKSTVYRKLKQLEDLRLIKSLRTREKTIYVVLAVPPPRPEAGPTPLFDAIEGTGEVPESLWSPEASVRMSFISTLDSSSRDHAIASVQHEVASMPHFVAPVQPTNCISEKRNKEEQDSLNKTQEQDPFNKNWEQDNPTIKETAQRVLNTLGLPPTSLNAAIAAVQMKAKHTKATPDGVLQDICTASNFADRRGTDKKDFLDDFLARNLAEQILKNLGLPVTNSMVITVTAAVKAEVTFSKDLPMEAVAEFITNAALEDSRKGAALDRFYFENVKWRSNGRGVSRAEQRTLDNLEVNARVKQRLRDKFGTSRVD
jgi:antitoxin component of RelBE/YafQ-DinJ toxin-antitoxin module